MQKKLFSKICVGLAMTLTWSCFGGCFDSVGSTPTEYTVQYTDDTGLHTLSVTSGAVYALETLPEKYGYEFLGLFDAKTGGTQYIDETGSSLSAFSDDKNLVLFPQFKAKEYTLILDYQGAPVTGSRSVKVNYDSAIGELPTNLSYAYKEFKGWYTEPNGKGTKIADEYGVLPEKNKITKDVFDLSETDNNIYLYAGFESVKYSVKFYIGDNNAFEEMQVEHGTDIKNVVPETRVNGNAVLTWSTVKNDTNKEQVFTGKVISDMILYATEYAPVIDFDENGGEEVIPVVARADSAISLPEPTRENYKFIEWQDESGIAYTSTTMPAQSITLKAVWQAKLVFDENGGTEVSDISKAAGESLELPMPEKEGFIFAGWYTADKEKYEAKTMPSMGIALKAGWYKAKEETISIRSVDDRAYKINYTYNIAISERNTVKGPSATMRETVDLSAYLPKNGGEIKVELNYKMATATSDTVFQGGFYFYDEAIVSDANYLTHTVNDDVTNVTKSYIYKKRLCLRNNTLYLCYYAKSPANEPDGYSNTYIYFSDIWMRLTYPDTTKLYL